jgi:peptidoglycan biosynthesis protein MviN/MurJ (putative lipid II flippase)
MWRAMGLSSAIALAVFPLYLVGGRLHGVTGLALASLAAISLNAVVTVVWLRMRAGSPDGLALLETLVRTLAIVFVAGGLAHGAVDRLAPFTTSPFVALAVGGGLYGVAVLIGVRLLGDAPLRAGLARLVDGLVRRAGRTRAS